MSTKSQFPVLSSVEVKESTSTCEISADITGFHVNDVTVTGWDELLIIEMSNKHEPGQSYYLGELDTESYRRIIPLGFDFDPNSLKTQFTNGTVNILVQKCGEAAESKAKAAASAV